MVSGECLSHMEAWSPLPNKQSLPLVIYTCELTNTFIQEIHSVHCHPFFVPSSVFVDGYFPENIVKQKKKVLIEIHIKCKILSYNR